MSGTALYDIECDYVEIVLHSVPIAKKKIFLYNEPIRRLFASVGYQNPNLQWLHQTMVDMLPRYLCGPYVDVLCSLRSKVPHLMNGSLEPILSQGDTRAARALGFTTRIV